MSDSGYTLAETMVALIAVALAMSGLSAAVQVLARGQSLFAQASGATDAMRRAQVNLQRLVGAQGPFRSDRPAAFRGNGQQFQFDCGQAATCAVQLVDQGQAGLRLDLRSGGGASSLPLKTSGPAHFEYRGALTNETNWPPEGNPLQALRAISLVQDGVDGHAVLLETHLWVQEAMSCAFDPVLRDCR